MPSLPFLKGKNHFRKLNSFIYAFSTHILNIVYELFHWKLRSEGKITQLDTTDTLKKKLIIARQF